MPKKKIILTAILLILLSGGIFFVCQWWQMRGELRGEIKNNISLNEINADLVKKMEKASFFRECDKLEFPKQGPITLQLLGAFRDDYKEHIWYLIIIDPEGHAVGSGLPREAGGMGHGVTERAEGAWITPREKIGDYLIIIAPDQDTAVTDTYSIQINNSIVLAKNASYSPSQLDRVFILRQTEDGIIPIVPASVGCNF